MVDSDGFIYSRKKPKDTALYSAWRCRETNPSHEVLIDFEKAVTATSTSAKLSKRTFRRSLKFCIFLDKKFTRAARLVVFLAFVPIADVEDVFYEITYYIQSNYPQLMVVVNYFENTYLGPVIVDKEERVPPKFPLGFWNH